MNYEADKKREWKRLEHEAQSVLNTYVAKVNTTYAFVIYGSIGILFLTYLILGLVSESFRNDVCEVAVGLCTLIGSWFESTWNVLPEIICESVSEKYDVFLMWIIRIVGSIVIPLAICFGLIYLSRKIYLLLKETPNDYHGYERISLWDKWFLFIVVTTFCLCVMLSNFIVIMFNWIFVWILLMVVMQGIRYSMRRMKYS